MEQKEFSGKVLRFSGMFSVSFKLISVDKWGE